MLLKLDSDVSIDDVKNDLNEKIKNGYCKNEYTFSINLIYKLIHEHSNYEDYQWQLYRFERKVVNRNITSLLRDISSLDKALTWDCMSILARYQNQFSYRNEIAKRYIRSQA
tara:strand:+ start:254 stop:589 length:336 start_codon:yes stop_codon:yes gene_type:complete